MANTASLRQCLLCWTSGNCLPSLVIVLQCIWFAKRDFSSLFLRGKQKCCSIQYTMFDCVKCHRDWFCSSITILISGVEPHVKKNTRRPGLRRNWTRPGKLCPCLKQVLGDCLLHVFKLHFFRFNSCGVWRGTEGGFFFPHSSSCDVNAASWMLTKCKCQDLRAGVTALSPRKFKAKLRDTVWQVTAVDTRNYKHGPKTRRGAPTQWLVRIWASTVCCIWNYNSI